MAPGKNQGRIRKGRDLEKWKNNRPQAPKGCIRIIGGIHRGQPLLYSGDLVTRPMKDNVREALFNLVGGYLEDTICFDLFAGTGAIGLEALSRKSIHSILVERHVPTTKIIRQNVESLDANGQTSICGSDTFFWVRQFVKSYSENRSPIDDLSFESLQTTPWAIFCCPPYDLFISKQEEILGLIDTFQRLCPENSLIVVESDSRFDPGLLPESQQWDSRQYSPALLSVWKSGEREENESELAQQNNEG